MSVATGDFDDELSRLFYRVRNWVYDNYPAAYVLGTGIILYTLTYWNLLAFVVSWSVVAVIGLLLEPCVNPHSSRYGPVLVKGDSALGMVVALTFDDGPGPQTEALLDLLRRHDVKVSFFCQGSQAQRYPEVVRRIVAEGHLLGSHSYSHRNLLTCSPSQGESDIHAGVAALQEITGQASRYFRAPYGFRAPWTASQLRRAGLTAISWNINPRDFQDPGATVIVERVMAEIQPGSIVLLHDGYEKRQQTLAAVDQLIPRLKEQGYRFVGIDGLLP